MVSNTSRYFSKMFYQKLSIFVNFYLLISKIFQNTDLHFFFIVLFFILVTFVLFVWKVLVRACIKTKIWQLCIYKDINFIQLRFLHPCRVASPQNLKKMGKFFNDVFSYRPISPSYRWVMQNSLNFNMIEMYYK